MSRIPSCDIRVQPIPTKPISVTKVVRVGSTVVFVDGKGRIYSPSVKDGFAYTNTWACRHQFEDLYRGLVKLGLIPQSDVDAHVAAAKAAAAKQAKKYAAEALRKDAKTLGLKLTAAQLRLLESAAQGVTANAKED